MTNSGLPGEEADRRWGDSNPLPSRSSATTSSAGHSPASCASPQEALVKAERFFHKWGDRVISNLVDVAELEVMRFLIELTPGNLTFDPQGMAFGLRSLARSAVYRWFPLRVRGYLMIQFTPASARKIRFVTMVPNELISHFLSKMNCSVCSSSGRKVRDQPSKDEAEKWAHSFQSKVGEDVQGQSWWRIYREKVWRACYLNTKFSGQSPKKATIHAATNIHFQIHWQFFLISMLHPVPYCRR